MKIKSSSSGLGQNEERFRRLIEETSDWIWEVDTEWRYVYASPKIKELLGYEPEEVLGKTPFSLMPQEEASRIQIGLWGMQESPQRIEGLENVNVHKDGRLVVLETSGVPVYDEAGQFCGYRGIDRDITQRKHTEEALRRSETRFRELVDLLPQVVYEMDREGTLTFANQKAFSSLGYTQEDLERGLNFLQMVVSGDRERGRQDIQRVLNGDRLPGIEYTALSKDGSTFPVLVHGAPIISQGRNVGVRGLLVDMTEHKQTEELLRKLSCAVEQSPISVMITDTLGNIEYVNPKFTRLTGYALEEVLGKNPRILKSGLTPATVYPALWNTITSGGEWVGEFQNRKKTGELYWELASISPLINLEGQITHFIGLKEDITERKRVEEALQESEERYRSLYTTMNEGVALHEVLYDQEGDPVDYRILDVNPAYESIFGVKKEQVVGSLGSSIYGSIPPPYLSVYGQVATTGHAISFQTSFEKMNRSLRISAFCPAKGKFAIILEDISERLQLEAQLLQAQKLETVGRLAGGIAHDFNNLLTVINCHSQLLAFQFNPNDPIRKDVEQIKKAGNQAAELVSQLLAFSRRQVLDPRVSDLNQVVGNMEKMLRRLIPENILLVTSLGARDGRVKTDPTQLEQVIVNLVVNASDALPHGGRIVIETGNLAINTSSAQRHFSLTSGDYVMMSVSDNGCGMDPETQARIFEPFFTTKEHGKGTGLGLSTVYGIIKQSGGHIFVDSAKGQGTTFKIYMPRIEAPVDVGKDEQDIEQTIGGKETVLLVEDDPNVRSLVQRILRDQGYVVLEASDPTEALRIAQEQGDTLDLLLTDVVMPQMSGYQLADRLAVLCPEIRVLYMSGYTSETVVHQRIQEPRIGFIPKPFTNETLLRRVRKTLDAPSRIAPVMVVDDDPVIREMLRRTLENAGFPVFEAGNGNEALARMEGKSIELLITDLVMPDGEGLEVIRTMKRTFPRLKVIAISGAFGGAFLKAAEFFGAHATLQKPFRVDELLDTVHRVLRSP